MDEEILIKEANLTSDWSVVLSNETQHANRSTIFPSSVFQQRCINIQQTCSLSKFGLAPFYFHVNYIPTLP